MSNKETIYNKRMKVADLLANDGNLLSILQRLDIKLGFGEATVAELCARYGISAELFLIICNIYSFGDYRPEIESLGESDIKSITTYLRASHRYYTGICFPNIHNSVHKLVSGLDEVSHRLIDKFYDDYDNEVNNHFRYEEEVVFPYIESLITEHGCNGERYNIGQFEHNHSNINEKLNDLKNIITKYLNEEYSSPLSFELLADIYSVEKDLCKHSLIENRLLIPLVEKMEKNNEQRG
ncbi:MAG: hemerythrin domain-containing protein [Bacteroidaceae bacterium]|nr:hemerythrin domain-containing protein [Bacteroidaceae bacterium]